jgi:hypothetical protein
MIDKLLNQIKEKKDELSSLKAQLEKEGLKMYENLIGKYYCLAATCYIKIKSIEYITTNSVNVECVRIQGGKHDAGRIHIDPFDAYELSFNDINEGLITEVSQDRFILFLEEVLNETRKQTLETIS